MSPVISKFIFCSELKEIETCVKFKNDLDDLLTAYDGFAYLPLPTLEAEMICLLENIMGDTELIYSWIYDRDFGRVRYNYWCIDEYEHEVEINSAEELYDCLCRQLNNEKTYRLGGVVLSLYNRMREDEMA